MIVLLPMFNLNVLINSITERWDWVNSRILYITVGDTIMAVP